MMHSLRQRISRFFDASLLGESWAMGWPLILVMLFEFLIAITDVYIAGRFGKEVQGAVGFSAQVHFIFVVLANAVGVGAVSLASRQAGAGECADFSRTVRTLITVSLISGAVLSAAGVLTAPVIVRHARIPATIATLAGPYLMILFASLVFHYTLIISNALLRSAHRPRRSLLTMSIVAMANIGINAALYLCTDIGYTGIAVSTAASYTIGCLLNMPAMRTLAESSRPLLDTAVLRRVFHTGWPTFVMQVAWQLGTVTLFMIAGSLPARKVEVIAALTNGLRIESAIFLPAYALNMASAAIVGKHLGASRTREAYHSGITTALLGAILISVLSVIVIAFARPLAGMLSPNTDVVRETVRYLTIQMLVEPFMAMLVILAGALNGAGDTRSVMLVIGLSMWLVRIPLAWLLGIHLNFGPAGIWWAMNIDILVRLVLIGYRYRGRRWLSLARR